MKSNNPRQMQEVRPLDVQAQDTTALAAVEAALKSSLDECSRLRQQLSEVTGRLNATRGECNSRRPLTAAAYSTHRMTPAETEWCRQRLRPCMPEALARVLRQPQAKAPDAQVEKEAECCEGGGTMVQVGTMRPLSGRVQRITSFIGAEPFDCVSVMRRSHSNSLIVHHTVSPVSESLSSSRKGSELKRRTSSRAELLASFAPPAAFPYQNELFDPLLKLCSSAGEAAARRLRDDRTDANSNVKHHEAGAAGRRSDEQSWPFVFRTLSRPSNVDHGQRHSSACCRLHEDGATRKPACATQKTLASYVHSPATPGTSSVSKRAAVGVSEPHHL